MKNNLIPAALILAIVLASCGTQSRFVLLPEESGGVGRLEVTSENGKSTLTEAYQSAATGTFGLSSEQLSADEVKRRYGNVIDALPRAAQRFVLYFEAGGQVLTTESQQQIAAIRSALSGFATPEIVVTGHTDRVGAVAANDALSLKRAETVRELLVAEGFKRETISVVGRGERESAVQTDDEVDDARNRRVEVKLR